MEPRRFPVKEVKLRLGGQVHKSGVSKRGARALISGPGRLCSGQGGSPTLTCLVPSLYGVTERNFIREIWYFGFRMGAGCLGEHREGLLLSFWIPEDCEKLRALLLESPGPKRSPTGSAPPHLGEDGFESQLFCCLATQKGHFWTILPVLPQKQHLEYWVPSGVP